MTSIKNDIQLLSPVEYGTNEEFEAKLDGITHLLEVHARFHVSEINRTDVGTEIHGYPVATAYHIAAYDSDGDVVNVDRATRRETERYVESEFEHQLK